MDHRTLVPIVLFLCITYVVRLAIDARMRIQLLKGGASEDTIRSIVAGEQRQRRYSTLHMGLLWMGVATAFGLLELIGLRVVTPGAIALIAAAIGAANLSYFAIARRLDKDD